MLFSGRAFWCSPSFVLHGSLRSAFFGVEAYSLGFTVLEFLQYTSTRFSCQTDCYRRLRHPARFGPETILFIWRHWRSYSSTHPEVVALRIGGSDERNLPSEIFQNLNETKCSLSRRRVNRPAHLRSTIITLKTGFVSCRCVPSALFE